MSEFDRYASGYDAALAHALAATGENKEYFARGRVDFLHDCLASFGVSVKSVLDFGCGVGSGSDLLGQALGAVDVLGVDVSGVSIAQARRAHAQVRFLALDEYEPAGAFDLAFCNGVFHHIVPGERPAAVDIVFRSLRPGGFFAFWENNPWNPGTRYVMSRCEFDRDAMMLSPSLSRRLLASRGFDIVSTRFLFLFPRMLHLLRRAEKSLSRWPIGAQYQVLCRKRA
jgi:SAM-dependent methyltransferase